MDLGSLRPVIQLVAAKKLVLSEPELATITERVVRWICRF